MALSFTTVQEAYKVLHKVKEEAIPNLNIKSWPEDMANWDWQKKENPPENVLLGWDKKSDDGWENLIFFVNNPSESLIKAFKEHNIIKGNSSMCRPYKDGSTLWIMGWF